MEIYSTDMDMHQDTVMVYGHRRQDEHSNARRGSRVLQLFRRIFSDIDDSIWEPPVAGFFPSPPQRSSTDR